MIRNILATAATAALMSTAFYAAGAHAANTPATQTAIVAPVTDGNLVSKIMGTAVYDSTADDATKIGDVKDVVLDKDGKARLVVIGVGGFLGMGEKDVALTFDQLSFATDNNDPLIVKTNASKESLQAAPQYTKPEKH